MPTKKKAPRRQAPRKVGIPKAINVTNKKISNPYATFTFHDYARVDPISYLNSLGSIIRFNVSQIEDIVSLSSGIIVGNTLDSNTGATYNVDAWDRSSSPFNQTSYNEYVVHSATVEVNIKPTNTEASDTVASQNVAYLTRSPDLNAVTSITTPADLQNRAYTRQTRFGVNNNESISTGSLRLDYSASKQHDVLDVAGHGRLLVDNSQANQVPNQPTYIFLYISPAILKENTQDTHLPCYIDIKVRYMVQFLNPTAQGNIPVPMHEESSMPYDLFKNAQPSRTQAILNSAAYFGGQLYMGYRAHQRRRGRRLGR